MIVLSVLCFLCSVGEVLKFRDQSHGGRGAVADSRGGAKVHHTCII